MNLQKFIKENYPQKLITEAIRSKDKWNQRSLDPQDKHPVFLEKLRNKKLTIGEYTFHFSLTDKVEREEKDRDKRYDYFDLKIVVMVEFRGVFSEIYKYLCCQSIKKERSRIFNDDDNILILEEKADYADDFLKVLESDFQNHVLSDTEFFDLDFWDHNNKKVKDSVSKSNFLKFVEEETKNGVYKPEEYTVNFLGLNDWEYSLKEKFNFEKLSLKDLGIHTVHLRNDCYYPINHFFNLKGITVKASEKILSRHEELRKYSQDKEVLNKIKEKEEKAERKFQEYLYNNTYTLMQHGKVILQDVQKEDLIDFLEKTTTKDFEEQIKEVFSSIFTDYPEVKKFNLAAWGTYFKYESGGERYCFQEDLSNDHIDKKTLRSILEDYDIPYPDEDILELLFEWPERGGTMMVIKQNKRGKPVIDFEDYDPE